MGKMNNGTMRLAGALEDLDWQLRSKCRDTDPDFFFVPIGASDTQRDKIVAEAKAFCRDGCPVVQQCLDRALELDEPAGSVFGGMDWQERQAEKKRRAATGTAGIVSVRAATSEVA